MYHYVTGKEELLFLIQYRTFSSLLDNFRQKADSTTDPQQKLRIMIENHIEHYVKHMDQLVVCTHELQTLEGNYYDQVFKKRKDYFLDTLDIIKTIGAQGEGPAVDPHIATLYLFGMLNWIYMWHNPKINTSPKTLADQMAHLFLSGYQTDNRVGS